MSTAAIILAAGFSRRLGRPKQTLTLHGETLIHRAGRLAAEAGCAPVLIVVNREADFCAPLETLGWHCIRNERAAEGIASSIRCGIAAAKSFQATGAVLITCDQIALDAQHLSRLVEDITRVTASRYAGHVGIPAYFPAARFDDLLQLHGDRGARHILETSYAIPNEDLAVDIDTEADLAHLAR